MRDAEKTMKKDLDNKNEYIQQQLKFSKAAHSQAVANIYNLNSSEDLMKEAIIFDEFERIKD